MSGVLKLVEICASKQKFRCTNPSGSYAMRLGNGKVALQSPIVLLLFSVGDRGVRCSHTSKLDINPKVKANQSFEIKQLLSIGAGTVELTHGRIHA